jgi:quinoprotein glucose dehydrogenase
MRHVLTLVLVFACVCKTAGAQPAVTLATNGLTPELEMAIKKLHVTPGFKAEIFASEPLIQNPVNFCFDEKGRAFVVETFRRRTSVFDIRNHADWLDDEFSFRTVADRSNFFRKVLVPGNTNLPPIIVHDRNGDGKFDFHDLEVESDRLRLVTDENHDGFADKAVTFADDFKTIVSGVAAGVLAHKGNVYFACIPDLWLLRDEDGDGVAEFRKKLATGFGVHISFGGHDLHGLKLGPDGKLYFTVADRGLDVITAEGKHLSNPDSGAVLRCNQDGSDLELFATGLRNPQELAFDQYGNLWTGDNNGDGGDKARWLYVVEGGEYGWHMGWQHLPKMGAWNLEGLWEFPPKNTATYLLPPIAHIGHGPAGVAFYPGTGMPDQYKNHFFMCDFPGGVHSFAVQPRGAGFTVYDERQFLWELYPVDVDFGPDGGAYVLDWVQGWEKTGKGRLFRVFEEKSAHDPLVAQTRKLLADGFEKRGLKELGDLLAFPDMRVRQAAQFELADRGTAATNVLAQTALNSTNQLARIHALWGLGQIARSQPMTLMMAMPLFDDPDPEIRAQVAKVMGDSGFPLAAPNLARAALDPEPRVQFFGVLGLGKVGSPDAADPVLQVLRENNDRDPFLRHACVMALTMLNDMNAIDTAARGNSQAAKLGALLAMRRLHRPEVAMFLYESQPQLVLEAARAIYDVPITNAMTQLAAMISKPTIPKGAMRRALHANYRLGKLENAMALSEFASNTNFLAELRADAIELLGRWAEGTKRDLFLGLWRPLPPREVRAASISFRSELPNLLKPGPEEVRLAAIEAASRLDVDAVAGDLVQIVTNKAETAKIRVTALKALEKFKDPRLSQVLSSISTDSNSELRKEASTLRVKGQSGDTLGTLVAMLNNGVIPEKQTAIEMLGTLPGKSADPVLLMWLDRVVSGKAPPELDLEILEAAAKRNDPLIKSSLDRFNKGRANDPMAQRSECLAGGDANLGKKIFFERQDVQCIRCHKLAGTGGEVGPDLTGVGARLTRAELLESIVLPNARIAKGFQNLVIKMKDGHSYAGLLKKEDLENIYIDSPEDGPLRIPKDEVQDLNPGLSAMPAEIASMLSKRDLRNLIEFLAAQK